MTAKPEDSIVSSLVVSLSYVILYFLLAESLMVVPLTLHSQCHGESVQVVLHLILNFFNALTNLADEVVSLLKYIPKVGSLSEMTARSRIFLQKTPQKSQGNGTLIFA